MSKALFRYLRGELNGFYLTGIHNTLNVFTEDVKSFFVSFSNMQFEAGKIPAKTLYNIGKFASIFLPRAEKAESLKAIYMTEGHEVNGSERSERGLFNADTELFDFVHTEQDDYPDDINTLASETLRSSMVGNEPVEGYIAENEDEVLDDNGNVRPEKLLHTPPQNLAYSDFHGDKFLYLSEGDTSYEPVNPALFIELYKVMQWIRYNGTSMSSLVKLIDLICPSGLVKLDRIEASQSGTNLFAFYVYNDTVEVPLKAQRLVLLNYVIATKFPQVILTEIQ